MVIAGAGLPGLALAARAARQRASSVALVDRAAVSGQPDAIGRRRRRMGRADLRHQPGRARPSWARIGAWAELPDVERLGGGRVDARCRRPGRRAVDLSAYDADERALAWIVEERALMSARSRRRAHALPGSSAADAPATVRVARVRRDRQQLTLADGDALAARLVVGADGLQLVGAQQRRASSANPKPYGQTASSPISRAPDAITAARGNGSSPTAACWLAAAAGTADVDRLVGARRDRVGADGARRTERSSRRWRRPGAPPSARSDG